MLTISFQTVKVRNPVSSSYLLIFEKDVFIPTLTNILQPKLRYLGDVSALLCIEILRETCMVAAENLKMASSRQPNKVKSRIPKSIVGGLELLKIYKKYKANRMLSIC